MKYQGGVLDRIMGGARFLKLFPKTRKKWILFKTKKDIQKKKKKNKSGFMSYAILISNFLKFPLGTSI